MKTTTQEPFSAIMFIPTKFSTAEDKAKFANHFIRFVEAGFPKTLFVKWFYNQLRMCFQHIAHYDLGGFYEEWFATDEKKLAFLKYTIDTPSYGDPTFTYCDVEKEIRTYIRAGGYLGPIRSEIERKTKASDLAELKRLMEKYPKELDEIMKTCGFCKTGKVFRNFAELEAHQNDQHGIVS